MDLFKKQDYEALKKRIENLSPNSERQWGSLTHAQMLAHCTKVLNVALTDYKSQYFLGKLFGKKIVSNILKNKYEMKKGIKSSKKLFEAHPKSFDEEKAILLETFKQFHKNGAAFYENKLHPFFGRLTADTWNTLTYKHLNHHLTQFSS
jgi:uncharacterized protein DUF1569